MKRLLFVLFLYAAGCAALSSGSGERKQSAEALEEYSAVLVPVRSHEKRDALMEQLKKEFKVFYPSLSIHYPGWHGGTPEYEERNKKVPIGIGGLCPLVEKAVIRITEILSEGEYTIKTFPGTMKQIRLPDVLLIDPGMEWTRNVALPIAAEKILSLLVGRGELTYCTSGPPASITREDQREFIFDNAPTCRTAYNSAASLVRKNQGIIIRHDKYLYCAGSEQLVSSVVEGVTAEFELRRYAFTSLRLRRLHDLLPAEGQELCKYILCKSIEYSAESEWQSIWSPFLAPCEGPEHFDPFCISLARYAIATETIENWKAIKEGIRIIEEYGGFRLIPAVGVPRAIKFLVRAKDKASVPLLFSKALVACATGVDYGTEYVEGIAGILGEDAVWHLTAIAESPTASFETRREAMAYLEKIDTPEAKSAVRQLKCIPLPEEDDLEDDDDTDDE